MGLRLVEGARVDFRVLRRGFVLVADSLRQAHGPRRPAEGIAQRIFDFIGPVSSARPGLHTAARTRPCPILDGGQSGTNAASLDALLAARPMVNGTGDDTAMAFTDPVSGAFTFEAIVRRVTVVVYEGFTWE